MDVGRRNDPARGRRGVRRTVTSHVRYATADRDEAEAIIADLYLPNRLDLANNPAPLDMEVSAMRLGALTAGRLTYGRPVRIQTAEAADFHLDIPLHGWATSSNGNGDPVPTLPGEGLVFSPGSPPICRGRRTASSCA